MHHVASLLDSHFQIDCLFRGVHESRQTKQLDHPTQAALFSNRPIITQKSLGYNSRKTQVFRVGVVFDSRDIELTQIFYMNYC